MPTWLKISLAIASLVAIERFCHAQTRGFRLSDIIATDQTLWELPPPTREEKGQVTELLSQPFRFLGGGEQCYAFLGTDGQTVLKLFRHTDGWKQRSLEHVFASSHIAYTQLKQESGLLYLQLNKRSEQWPLVTLYDPIGIQHQIDLNQTEFALQEKGELLFTYIDRLIRSGQKDAACAAIQNFHTFLRTLCLKQISDTDPSVRRNYAILRGRIIALDIGSFRQNPNLSDPKQASQEISIKEKRLVRYLRKHHPEFLTKLSY